MNARTIAYWVVTAYVAMAMFSTGLEELLDASIGLNLGAWVAFTKILGYPLYFFGIIGTWKILGAIAILVPRFPRVKEWAYAGIFFNMSGATISWLAVVPFGAPLINDLIIDLHLLILCVVSWALRPQSRTLGVLFPAKIHE